MFDEQRFGKDGTEASRPCKPDDGDNQMNQKDEDIAHPDMVSKPDKTPDFGPIQVFAMDNCCCLCATSMEPHSGKTTI